MLQDMFEQLEKEEQIERFKEYIPRRIHNETRGYQTCPECGMEITEKICYCQKDIIFVANRKINYQPRRDEVKKLQPGCMCGSEITGICYCPKTK